MSAKPETPSAPVERLTHDLRTAFPNLDAVRLNSHRADRQIGRSTALENGSARRYDVTTTSPAASSVGCAGLFGGPFFFVGGQWNHRLRRWLQSALRRARRGASLSVYNTH